MKPKPDTFKLRGIEFGILRSPDGTIPYKLCARPSELAGPPLFPFELVPCCMCWAELSSTIRDNKYAPNAKPLCFDCARKLVPSTVKAQ